MSNTTAIPKELGHIWIGPLDPPQQWMDSWRRCHPHWNYTLYDNQALEAWEFCTRHQINEYLARGDYPGAADLMRYEILLEKGGFIAGADSLCLKPVDPLFTRACAYTVYENEFLRGKLVAPIMACEPGNPFVRHLVEKISNTSPESLDIPWKSTGNLFVSLEVEAFKPDIVIFPSYYFIPEHFNGIRYTGNGPVYAHQYFGATNHLYKGSRSFLGSVKRRLQKRYRKKVKRRAVGQYISITDNHLLCSQDNMNAHD